MANELSYPKLLSTDDGTLCDLCEDLLGGPFELSPGNVITRSLQSVQDGRKFCKFCDLIFRKVPRDPLLINRHRCEYRFTCFGSEFSTFISATYGPKDLRNGGRKFQFTFIPPRGESSQITKQGILSQCRTVPDVHQGRFFPGRLDSVKKSGRAQQLMQKWMDDCTTKHNDCRHVANNDWRPTRLLDIGHGPGFDCLRLCEGNEIAQGVQYMTLSHCWGDSQHIKLTRETHAQFRNSIAFTSLPKTFQDALEVVRWFGKRYIWIDSICILQDSTEDWHKEADTMCSVYRNAFCNIGATGASDSSQGCFIEHTDEVFRVPANWRTNYTRHIGPVGTDFYYFDKHEWDRKFETAPLHKRAWVVQERLLAPRMLHFGLSQVAWECNELRATERFPEGFAEHKSHDYNPKRLNSSLVRKSSFDLPYFRKTWYGVIAAYSGASLTVESDRIPALTGIIDRYKAITSDTFLAGLWRSTIHMDLAWWAVRPGKRHDSYVAPSWSWLSVKDTSILGGPKEPQNLLMQVGQVLHAEVTPSPGASKYTVMDGHIRCLGKLALATWYSKGKLRLWLALKRRAILDCRFFADTSEAIHAKELLLFPVCAYRFGKVYFLVLERNNEDLNTYRRIGIGMCEFTGRDTLWEACDAFTDTLGLNWNEKKGLEPVILDDILVYTGWYSVADYQKQSGVKCVSFTVK